jgi:hypothetical protein
VAVEAHGDWIPGAGRPVFPFVGREIPPGRRAPTGSANGWTRHGEIAEADCMRKGRS